MKLKSLINGRYVYSAWHRIQSEYYDLRGAGRKAMNQVEPHAAPYTGAMNAVSDYAVLKNIFAKIELSSDDVFVDCGCGRGRVISFLRGIKSECKIIGIECKRDAVRKARELFAERENVTIIRANFTAELPGEGTVFFLYCPLDASGLDKFLDTFERCVLHPAKLIYVDDTRANRVRCRDGWRLERAESVKLRFFEPTHYSVFSYMP